MSDLPKLNIKAPDPTETNMGLERILKSLNKDSVDYEGQENTILAAIYFIENFVPAEYWIKAEEDAPPKNHCPRCKSSNLKRHAHAVDGELLHSYTVCSDCGFINF